MNVGVALLAAGAGSRFQQLDQHKLLAPLRGRPVVAWALEAMRGAGFAHQAVVTGAVDLGAVLDSTAPDVTRLTNPDWADGQATSLQRAITWARSLDLDAVVIGLGDQPMVASEAWRAVGEATGGIVTAEYGGRRRPPVRLARPIWDLLPTGGDDGARALMLTHPELVTEISCVGNPADIDTLEDLQQWS
jgi:CTP:molybdopterin cytidylyltransferase MocA